MKTIKNNKILLDFIQARVTINTIFITGMYVTSTDDELKFDTDWNWLMEVVEKIESLDHKNNEEHFQLVTFIHHWFRRKHKELTKIEAVYNACVEFIEWYNEQK